MLASRRSGQSMMELLPAMAIFFMLLSGALAYYRAIRDATIKQEVVRNLIFTKINNSGTLTSPPNQVATAGGVALQTLSFSEFTGVSNVALVGGGNNKFMTNDADCFTAIPDQANATLSLGSIPFGGSLGTINFASYGVMYRDVKGGHCP